MHPKTKEKWFILVDFIWFEGTFKFPLSILYEICTPIICNSVLYFKHRFGNTARNSSYTRLDVCMYNDK